MPNFRKRPVEIDAVQWDPAAFEVPARHAHTSGVVQWVLDNGGTARWHEAGFETWGDTREEFIEHIAIDTLEGTMRALPGDWIIRGVAGEFYPCKPGIFEQTYEPSTNSERSAALTDLEHVMTLALLAADPDDADWRGSAIEQFRSDLRALGVTDAELDAHGLTLDTALSPPSSRKCSAGIGGGETCDLPDGHEGPHSSDAVEVTALTKLDRDAEGGFYGNADTIAVLSPSPTEDEPRYEGWNHAFVPKPRSKRCAQCAHPASHENHGPVSVVSPAASTATPTPIAVMRSIEEYRNAPSNTANAPRYDPAEALYAHVRDEMLAQVRAEDRAFGDALIAWYRDTKHSLLVSDNTVRQTDRELYRLLRPIIEHG